MRDEEAHPKDAAAGAELVFGPFKSRASDLIEGGDATPGAWHFRNAGMVD